MSKYPVNPKNVTNLTQSGENKVFVGKRKSVELLPAILQTDTNKRFLDTTLDNLLSSGTTETINTYWGRVTGKDYTSQDTFAEEINTFRQNYQLAPGFSLKSGTDTIDAVSYQMILNMFKRDGMTTQDVDALLAEPGYTFAPPINVDMFINYHNYYWLENDIPPCVISATSTNPIDIDTIVVQSQYTTPELANGKTLSFVNGMRVSFTGSNCISSSGIYDLETVYYVEGVGSKNITLVASESPSGVVFSHIQQYTPRTPIDWDGIGDTWDTDPWDFSVFKSIDKEYVVMDRRSEDQNAWARANQWYSVHAVRNTVAYNDLILNEFLKTQYRAQRPIIEFEPNLSLVNSGTNMLGYVNHVIENTLSSDIHGQTSFSVGNSVITNGDTILLSDTNEFFDVEIVNDTIILSSSQNIVTSNVQSGDKVVMLNHSDSALSGTEVYWTGTEWKSSQIKTHRGSAPIFKLFNEDGIDLASFEDSDYAGSTVFSYATNSVSVYDKELGFNPKYNSSNMNNDLVFESTINSIVYKQDIGKDSARDIAGQYYFKNNVTGELDNGWNLIREYQQTPLIKTYVADEGEEVQINIGTNDIGYSTHYVATISADKTHYTIMPETRMGVDISGSAMSTMLWEKNTEYTIEHLMDATDTLTFTCPFGTTTNLDIQVANNVVTLTVLEDYAYDTVIYSGNNLSGYIYLTSDNQRKITVKRGGNVLSENTDYTIADSIITFSSSATQDEIFEVEWQCNDYQEDVVYDVASVVKYNASNQPLQALNFSDIFPHFSHQMHSMPGFTGKAFGENSYHSMPRVAEYGGLIRRQEYNPSKVVYTTTNPETDVFNAITGAMTDYENFKAYFRTKVKQLWKSMPDSPVYKIVDEALTQINLGKNSSFKYTDSDMAYYGDFTEDHHFITVGSSLDYEMSNVVNTYNNRQNHVYVILNEFNGDKYTWRMLDPTYDYSVNGTTITLTNTPVLDSSNNPGQLIIRFKPIGESSWIPTSPAKLGFSKLTTVEVVDGYLIGHDGSKFKCTGTNFTDVNSPDFDIQAACLMDLERRFFVGATCTQSANISTPNANRQTPYSWNDTVEILDDTFNTWKAKNNIDTLTPENYYIETDKFTWNFSSVYPFIGGWKGIYNFFFGTDRPHTHPWEMLGYGVKPSWWDANYSWTDPVKRQSLINALVSGIISEPGQPVKIKVSLAKRAYDWSANELVTITGELNDPVSAGVVEDVVSSEAIKDFVFGDWGPVESTWRETSEYRFAVIRMMLKLKPISTYEQLWSSSKNASEHIHGYYPETNHVLSVEVKSAGNGYTTTPNVNDTITSFGNTQYQAFITDGKVSAVSILANTEGYTDNIELAIDGNAVLIAKTGQLNYVDYGINSVVAEYANQRGVTAEQLEVNIENLLPEMMIHVGGYTDKNVLNISLDSSYQKGKVDVPKTDFSILLKKSAPIQSSYYSAVRVKVLDYGYSVSGFDSTDQTFKYVPVSTGGQGSKVSIGEYELVRYHKFQNTVKTIPYGTVFKKRQDLYDFIVGLAEYYEQLGFRVRDNWISDASSVIYWTLDNTGRTSNEYIINGSANGEDDTLVFEQGMHGYVDYVGYTYNGQSSIIDESNKQISPKDMLVLRDSSTTEFSLKSGNNDIHGLSVNVVEYEHIVALSNVTEFNDVIFNPVTGIQHTRIKLEGERTRNWNGRLEAPGYIVRADGIAANFETSVREIERDSINTFSKTLNRLTRQTARFNAGHIQPSYLLNTFVEDSASYEFERGVRKYKGTSAALGAIMRNKNIFNTNPEYQFNEDWMIALGDFGDKSKRESIEFTVDPILIKSNPQVVRFNEKSIDDLTDTIIDFNQDDSNMINGDLSRSFDLLPYEKSYTTSVYEAELFEDFLPTSKMPLASDNKFVVKSKDDIPSVYDVTAEYANIPNWSSIRSYKLGEKVRHMGKVYELNISSTGVQLANQAITVRGSTIYPVIPSGSVLTLDGVDINFSKSSTSTTFNQIVLDGTEVNPTTENNTTLSLDGVVITFEKTDTSIVYNPIEYTGTVVNPSISGTAGKELLIDGVTIDFENQTSVVTNVTAKSAIETPIASYGIPSVTASNLAVELINATDNLRIAYETVYSNADWINWIDNYFSNQFVAGLNMAYLEAERDVMLSGYETALLNFIIANVKIINALQGTTYDVSSQSAALTVTVSNSDAIAAEAKLASGNYVANYAQYIVSGQPLQTSTVVATYTSPVTTIWNLTDIVQKINDTIPANRNITASADSGRLKLTKITSANDANLIIGTASANAEVGFVADIKTASSYKQTSAGILSLDEIVQKINSIGLSGISAFNVDDSLRIISINQTLVIGSGNNSTANNNLGLVSGVYTATINESTSLVDLSIFDIVNQINTASVPGITASNVNNNIVITSVNPTLTITETSASNIIGLMANTFNATEVVANEFNTSDWTQIADPALFSVQVLDGVGTNNVNVISLSGYNVFQVLDFNLEIHEICAGNRTGDDALVSVMSANHNLEADDLVMIINSGCTPSVDGIHKVTGVELDTHFYIDKFIEERGFGGKLLVLRPMRFTDNVSMSSAINSAKYYDSGLGIQPGTRAYIDSYVNASSNIITTGFNPTEGVSASFILNNDYQFVMERLQTQKADNSKLKNAVVYNYETNTTQKILEVFDPAKGIIPGIAEAEIKYKTFTDIAVYNNSTDEDYTVSYNQMWDERHIGEVWWDTSNAVYWDYEQGDIVYTQAYWGRLMPLSSIDLYEWTKSPVLPDLYEQSSGSVVDGIELTGTPYSRLDQYGQVVYYWTEQTEYDASTEQEETYYYFWVKNKTTVPNRDRKYSVIQLADIIIDPTNFGIDWVAIAGNNTVLFSNMDRYINDKASVVQLNFSRVENVDLHREYLLLTENDRSTVIPEWLHNGLRDSLAEFDKTIRKESYSNWNSTSVFSQGTLVKSSNGDFYRAIVNTPVGSDPDVTTDVHWARIYDAVEIVDDYNLVSQVAFNAPNPVPDTNLHPYARYGIQIKPRQTWIKNVVDARRVLVDKLNRQLSDITLIDHNGWDRVLGSTISISGYPTDITMFWDYIDWRIPTFDTTVQPDIIVEYRSGLPTDSYEGQIALVQKSTYADGINRKSMYKVIDGVWELQYKQKATIQFNSLLWDYERLQYGWDSSTWDTTQFDHDPGAIVGELLDAIRNNVFVGQYLPLYADMWFTMLHYINSEQPNIDWAFKSTYIKGKINYALESSDKMFRKDSYDELVNYINTVKPFHSKLRDLATIRDVTDVFAVSVDEGERSMTVTLKAGYTGNNNINVITGTSFTDVSDTQSSSLFTDTDIITYNGGNFDSTVNLVASDNTSDDIVDTDIGESLEIIVYTSTVPDNSQAVAFRMHYTSQGLEESSVVTPVATLATDIDATTASIEFVGTIPALAGIVWIGNEQVSYTHIVNNTLMNCTRGYNNTAEMPHESGTTVYMGGTSVKLNVPTPFSLNGDDLTPAYNVFGESIVTSTPPNNTIYDINNSVITF